MLIYILSAGCAHEGLVAEAVFTDLDVAIKHTRAYAREESLSGNDIELVEWGDSEDGQLAELGGIEWVPIVIHEGAGFAPEKKEDSNGSQD